MEIITAEDLFAAALNLSKTARGRDAMQRLLAWLDADGLRLDSLGQESVITILQGAWGPFAGTARDAMRDYVSPTED